MEMDDLKNNKTKNHNKIDLISKLIMFTLVIGYLIYFIYSYINSDFDWHDEHNMFKVILLVINIFLLGMVMITNKSVTLFFSIMNYILIITLISTTFLDILPNDKKEIAQKTNIPKKETLTETCTGETDMSTDTSIFIKHQDDQVYNLIYTYQYPLEEQNKADEIVKKFNEQYQDIEGIYGEISINNKITVKLTYNIQELKKEEQDMIKDKLSYEQISTNELQKLTCKEK